MNQEIEVIVTSNYGTRAVYIISEAHKWILKLTGKKTLTDKDIAALKEAGFTFKIGSEFI